MLLATATPTGTPVSGSKLCSQESRLVAFRPSCQPLVTLCLSATGLLPRPSPEPVLASDTTASRGLGCTPRDTRKETRSEATTSHFRRRCSSTSGARAAARGRTLLSAGRGLGDLPRSRSPTQVLEATCPTRGSSRACKLSAETRRPTMSTSHAARARERPRRTPPGNSG